MPHILLEGTEAAKQTLCFDLWGLMPAGGHGGSQGPPFLLLQYACEEPCGAWAVLEAASRGGRRGLLHSCVSLTSKMQPAGSPHRELLCACGFLSG